jgi:hypothetical protein
MITLIADYHHGGRTADQCRFNLKRKRNLETTKSGTIQEAGELGNEEKRNGCEREFPEFVFS